MFLLYAVFSVHHKTPNFKTFSILILVRNYYSELKLRAQRPEQWLIQFFESFHILSNSNFNMSY